MVKPKLPLLKIIFLFCFTVGGLCAFVSAKIDIDAENSPDQKSFIQVAPEKVNSPK